MKAMDKIPCPHCEHAGFVGQHTDDGVPVRAAICPVCNGDQVVPIHGLAERLAKALGEQS